MNPRKPTHLKIVLGTQKKCRVNHAEPRPQGGRIAMPKGLTPLHQKAWKRLAGAIQRMGATTQPDAVALERLVACYVEILEAEASIARPILATRVTKDGEILERSSAKPASDISRATGSPATSCASVLRSALFTPPISV